MVFSCFDGRHDDIRHHGFTGKVEATFFLTLFLLARGYLLSCGLEDEFFSAVLLYPKLLSSCGYLTCRVRIKIIMLQLLENVCDLGYVLLYARLLSMQFEENGLADVDANSSIELIIAAFQLFHQENSLPVGTLELSSHYYNHYISPPLLPTLPHLPCISSLLEFLICQIRILHIKWRNRMRIQRGRGLTYINQSQLLKLRMKRFDKIYLPREDVFSQTCIGDSDSLSSPQRPPNINRRFKKLKGTRQASHPSATQIRLFRFRLKHTRKTLRIPLFEQELLNLPVRFTRKTNPMEADNDVDTDEEMACSQAERCRFWLMEAITEQK